MSLSFQELPVPSETTALQARVDRLRASMEWAADAIDPEVRDLVFATIERCDHRLGLGVDSTVVALAGGTGSGKSSLFNAITRTDFAVVGALRPTTSQIHAASWSDAFGLLEWLGVDTMLRLRLPPQDGLAKVVLLDLPDHDSINLHNRDTVDRVVPLVDLVVWVVDPQKYADHALHSAYLKAAIEQGQPCLVVLNHVDRLSAADAELVAADLARLVGAADSSAVIKASARTGQGIDALRLAIATAATGPSVAAEAVRSDLVAAGRALDGALARDAEPVLPDVVGLVAALARAAGVEARADAAAAFAVGGPAKVIDSLTAPLAAVEQVRLEWIDAATAGLPLAWRSVLGEAVAGADVIALEIDAALAALTWPDAQRPSGIGALTAKATKGHKAAQDVLTVGRSAIAAAVQTHIVEPTVMIHQAYRNLDELRELA